MYATILLPRAAPHKVLALGAWLKNTACYIAGDRAHISQTHGDLAELSARDALHKVAEYILRNQHNQIEAIAHDAHPDFYSSQLAQIFSQEYRIPCIAVQHHLAHAAAVKAEFGLEQNVIALSLDGVGWGSDGNSWGSELLLVREKDFLRLDHLPYLMMPGGDKAATETWRMAVSALYRMGKGNQAEIYLDGLVAPIKINLLLQMIEKNVQCPLTCSLGRWFDAVAGMLRLNVEQSREAQAAQALENAAQIYLNQNDTVDMSELSQHFNFDELLQVVLQSHLAHHTNRAAAIFHYGLAKLFCRATVHAANKFQVKSVVLSGGCFYNNILKKLIQQQLQDEGLTVYLSQKIGFGDASISLGQAWFASHFLPERNLNDARYPSQFKNIDKEILCA